VKQKLFHFGIIKDSGNDFMVRSKSLCPKIDSYDPFPFSARITKLNPHEAGAYKNLLYQMRTFAKTERKRLSEELLPKISLILL